RYPCRVPHGHCSSRRSKRHLRSVRRRHGPPECARHLVRRTGAGRFAVHTVLRLLRRQVRRSQQPMKPSLAVLAVAPFLLSACSVKLANTESTDVVQNQCTSDRDCDGGVCWLNVCVAHEGALPTLLLELTPPVTAPAVGIGGLRYLRMETNLSRSNEQHD